MPDGVRTGQRVILDGIRPPLLVLLATAGLVAGRRIIWTRPRVGQAVPPPWTDLVIIALTVALSATLLLAMGRPLTYHQ